MRTNPLCASQIVKGALKKPAWLKLKIGRPNEKYKKIRAASKTLRLATVCEEAMCPNIADCWGCGTATFMIMGDTCTRACRFCNVNHGRHGPIDPEEPRKLAETIAGLGIEYAVITSVDRDDLPDLGAAHFAACIYAIRKKCPKITVEVLTPDFQGKTDLIQKVINASPSVFGHNIETVERLQKSVRDIRAGYKQSLFVLEYVKKLAPEIRTKSSIMVGLGETPDEVLQAMRDLRASKVDFLTIGQYLRPTEWNLPVKEYVEPAQFERYRKKGLEMGFRYVAAGPFVRSSYKAAELFASIK